MTMNTQVSPAVDHDATLEVVARQVWQLFAFGEVPTAQRCAKVFVEELGDGSARLLFERQDTPDFASPTYREDAAAEARRRGADPLRVVAVVALPAGTFADLDAAISLVNRLG